MGLILSEVVVKGEIRWVNCLIVFSCLVNVPSVIISFVIHLSLSYSSEPESYFRTQSVVRGDLAEVHPFMWAP